MVRCPLLRKQKILLLPLKVSCQQLKYEFIGGRNYQNELGKSAAC
jgi:hypothetical protein